MSQDPGPLSELDLSLERRAGEALEYLMRTLQQQSDETRLAMERLADALNRMSKLMPGAAKTLGQAGWIIPFDFTPGELVNLGNLVESAGPSAVDNWFISFYSNPIALNRLERKIVTSPYMTPWAKILEECFWAYRNGRFTLIPPAALAAIEGSISSLLRQLQNPRASDASKTWRKHAQRPEPGYIRSIFWEAIDSFLSRTWESSPFDQELPAMVNRHVAHHGRRVFETQADALRLLVALACLVDNWSYFKTDPVEERPPSS